MSIKRSKSTMLFIGALLSAISSAMAKEQCDETESLLKVSFKIDEEGWDHLYPLNYTGWRWDPDLVVRPSGNTGNFTTDVWVEYKSFDDVVDFETCIPKKGSCIELTVSIFPTNAYSISWDGNAVEPGQAFTKYGLPIMTTELGEDCTPLCDEGTEALFDYQYWTSTLGTVDAFRVTNQSGDTVLRCENEYGTCGDPQYQPFSMFRYRECLPKDTCYQFFTGHGTQLTPSEDGAYVPSLLVKFDDAVVEESDSWRFISTSFGSNCVPDCNAENESTVEFLMYRELDRFCGSSRPDLDYNWTVTLKNADGTSATASSGVVPHCPTTTLFREIICLPRHSCASFHIKSMNDTFTDQTAYSLKMDGIQYRSKDSYSGWNETTNIGSCTAGALCDSSSQALFELELQTSTNYSLPNGEPSSVIPGSSVWWIFGSKEYLYRDTFFYEVSYNDAAYDLGAVYRVLECVPNQECTYDFNITSSSPVDKYTVKRNGVELSRIIDPSGYTGGSLPGSVETTAFGNNCPESKQESKNKLSGGAIAGIVIGSLIASAWIVMGLVYLWRKKKNQISAVEQDPLAEDLLSDSL